MYSCKNAHMHSCNRAHMLAHTESYSNRNGTVLSRPNIPWNKAALQPSIPQIGSQDIVLQYIYTVHPCSQGGVLGKVWVVQIMTR